MLLLHQLALQRLQLRALVRQLLQHLGVLLFRLDSSDEESGFILELLQTWSLDLNALVDGFALLECRIELGLQFSSGILCIRVEAK